MDKAEAKLREMKKLAECARDNNLDTAEVRKIKAKLHDLEKEVMELDGKSKVFWMDFQ